MNEDPVFLLPVAFLQEEKTETEIDTAQDWNKFFQENKVDQETVWDMASRMNNKKQHESLVRFLKAALINGHSQPWMYEVLAISMEITNQPKEDIERVLLSLSDFSPRDVPSLLASAAYLVRFKAEKQALKLYKQASRLAPVQPEPYALGLKLAKKENDEQAILWAASGILKHDWAPGYENRQREAEGTILNLIQKAEKNNDTKKANSLKNQLASLKQLDLSLRLEWSGNGDLNMSVEEPNGQTCSHKNRRTNGGGIHIFNGAGPNPEKCYEQYVCPEALPGFYRIHIQHLAGKIVGNRVTLKITRYKGTPEEQKKVIRIPLDQKEKIYKISLHEGRRKQQSALPIQLRFGPPPKTRTARIHEAKMKSLLGQTTTTTSVTAVGQQPIVTTISEGATLQASAIISADRRYVRINVQPIFSTITDVFTFSFLNQGNAPNNNQPP